MQVKYKIYCGRSMEGAVLEITARNTSRYCSCIGKLMAKLEFIQVADKMLNVTRKKHWHTGLK